MKFKYEQGTLLTAPHRLPKENPGTLVRLEKELSASEISDLSSALQETWRTNSDVPIYLNGACLNPVGEEDTVLYGNGNYKEPEKAIYISLDETGFSVEDT